MLSDKEQALINALVAARKANEASLLALNSLEKQLRDYLVRDLETPQSAPVGKTENQPEEQPEEQPTCSHGEAIEVTTGSGRYLVCPCGQQTEL